MMTSRAPDRRGLNRCPPPRLVAGLCLVLVATPVASAHHGLGHDAEQWAHQQGRDIERFMQEPLGVSGAPPPGGPPCDAPQDPLCLLPPKCVGFWSPSDANLAFLAAKASSQTGYGVGVYMVAEPPTAWGVAYHDKGNGCVVGNT